MSLPLVCMLFWCCITLAVCLPRFIELQIFSRHSAPCDRPLQDESKRCRNRYINQGYYSDPMTTAIAYIYFVFGLFIDLTSDRLEPPRQPSYST
jgi:hypothetical protein